MLAGVLMGVAFAIPAGAYFAFKPSASIPRARLRSATVLVAAAFIWASAVHTEPGSGTFVIQLVCGAILVAVAGAVLIKGRSPSRRGGQTP